MEYEKFKNEFLKDEKLRKEFEKYDLAFEVAKILVAARVAKKMTQAQLAKKMKTKQSGIARAESGDRLPSLSFLKKLADVYGTDLVPPKFKCMEESPVILKYEQNISTNNGLQTKSTLADWGILAEQNRFSYNSNS